MRNLISHAVSVSVPLLICGAAALTPKTAPTVVNSAAMIAFSYDAKETRLVADEVAVNEDANFVHDQLTSRHDAWKAAHPPPPPPPPLAPVVLRPVRYSPPSAPAFVYPRTGGGNHFSYGYCTFWVGSQRYVPWFGNASAWPVNALAYGFQEGFLPRVGAIMVQANHVALVIAVYSPTSWRVSEMNWWGMPGGGWNRVDYRTVNGAAIFIY